MRSLSLARSSASSLDVEFFCVIQPREHQTFLRERHRMYLDLLRLASASRRHGVQVTDNAVLQFVPVPHGPVLSRYQI